MREGTCPVCGARFTGRTCPSCGSDWPDDHTALFNAERNELADEERREEAAEQEAGLTTRPPEARGQAVSPAHGARRVRFASGAVSRCRP